MVGQDKSFLIHLNRENGVNFARFCYMTGKDLTAIDNPIREMIEDYLSETLTKKDLIEVDKIKAQELKDEQIQKEKENPAFEWDLRGKDK